MTDHNALSKLKNYMQKHNSSCRPLETFTTLPLMTMAVSTSGHQAYSLTTLPDSTMPNTRMVVLTSGHTGYNLITEPFTTSYPLQMMAVPTSGHQRPNFITESFKCNDFALYDNFGRMHKTFPQQINTGNNSNQPEILGFENPLEGALLDHCFQTLHFDRSANKK